MLEKFLEFSLNVAANVLGDLIADLFKKDKDAKSREEITEPEITNLIEKVLQEKRNEITENKIEDTNQLIPKVMNEIKILSKQINNLTVVNQQNQQAIIIFFEGNQKTDERFDPEQLTARLKEQLDKAVEMRQEEIDREISKTKSILLEVSEPKGTHQVEVEAKDENPDPPSDLSIKASTGIKTEPQEEEVSPTPLIDVENEKTASHRTIEAPEVKNPQPGKKQQMPNYLEKLNKYKEYGESILNGITSFNENQSLPDEVPPQLSECLEKLKEYAEKTKERAASPVKIAIMGEVSSGKTLLVGSLIGYADALPVNEIPTTGNVTAIHLIQQEDEKTTQVGQFKVEYLSEQGVKECLEFMLSEAKQRAQAVKLSSQQLEDLKKLTATNSVDWDGILEWCEQTWNTTNLELRYLIRELVIFARNYKANGKDICGKTYNIAQTTAKQGLKLGELANISQMDFSQLPPQPQQWQNLKEPSALELQQSFSLVRRIDVTVEVSKQVWDLSSLKGSNEFVLLDLPGLGSENSGVRDTWLSLLEIEEVQTFLLLLNGRASSPGQAATKIRTKIQEHKGEDLEERIVVGVGRFNQLPLTATNKEALNQLIDDKGPFSSTSEKVLTDLDTLKQIITSAESLITKKDRIVLLSQTFGLAELAQKSSLMQVCSPEFQPELNQVKQTDTDEYKLRQKWKKLSEILQKSEPRNTLARQLSDFADDGGIGRLRSLLEEHVAEHGLKLLHEDTRNVARSLRQQQKDLKKILEEIRENPILESNPLYTELREAINSLTTNYQDSVENLRKQPSLKYKKVAVSDVVKDELSFRVHHDWPQWSVLFNSIQDGIIKPTSATETAADNLLELRQRKKNNSIPTKSDDFYSTFEKTFKELKEFAHDRTKDALKELLEELDETVEPQRNTLGKILRPEMEDQIKKNYGEDAAELFYNLQQIYNPKEWWKPILKQINESNPTEESFQNINDQTLFPLANKDYTHEFGQIFDWSPQKQSDLQIPLNHEFLLLRLRSEMIFSAGLNLADYVSKLTKAVNSKLLAILLKQCINDVLLNLAKNEALLRYIAAGDQEIENPTWLEALSQIALITYPSV